MARSNPNQALWEQGDFTRIAATMRGSGERLVSGLGITTGMTILDVGCGDGTTALPAACLGADVLGVDISHHLVAAGRSRAQDAGLANLRFQQGDASHLHGLADGAFDLVVSVFGAMFAPRPYDVASELVRVARPGGRIVMGNWIPDDPTFVAELLRLSASYVEPPPAGSTSPVAWGIEPNVLEWFGAAGIPTDRVEFARETYWFEFAGSPTELAATFRDYYGPTMNAFAAAEARGTLADLQHEVDDLFARRNASGDPARTSLPATFLKVTVHV